MADEALRELERRAAAGDPQAAERLDAWWGRVGLGWWGEPLAPGVSRAAERGRYQVGGHELTCHRTPGGRVAVELQAVPDARDEDRSLHDSGRFEAALAAGWTRVALDLEPLVSFESWHLLRLVDDDRRCRAAGGRLVAFGAPPSVRQLLDLVGLTAHFTVPLLADLPSALAALDA